MDTKKIIVAMAILLLITPLVSCKGKPVKIASANSKKLVLVLCDFSSSIDSAVTRENVDKNIHDLFLHISAYPGTEYYFYSIGNSLGRHFAHDSILSDETLNNKEIGGNIQLLNQKRASLQSDSSCIIDCLSAIADKIALSQHDPRYTDIYLVLLSDMMEACPRGRIFINLEKENRYDQAMAWLKNWAPVKTYYADLPKLKINIVFSTNKKNDYEFLKSFWQLYFKKAGFPGDVSFGMEISASNFLP